MRSDNRHPRHDNSRPPIGRMPNHHAEPHNHVYVPDPISSFQGRSFTSSRHPCYTPLHSPTSQFSSARTEPVRSHWYAWIYVFSTSIIVSAAQECSNEFHIVVFNIDVQAPRKCSPNIELDLVLVLLPLDLLSSVLKCGPQPESNTFRETLAESLVLTCSRLRQATVSSVRPSSP
jgi:hypothetical protein